MTALDQAAGAVPHPSDMPLPELNPQHLADPRLWEPPTVEVIDGARSVLGVTYARPLGWRPLLLDLHLPAAPAGAVPVVVYAHGGSFVGGVREMGPWASLPARGIAVATIDYRLAGEVPYPEPIEDVRAALRWVALEGHRYGIDAGRVAGWGSSAGGYLMARAVLSGNRAVGRPVGLAEGETSTPPVSALVLHYAPADFSTLLADAFEPTPAAQQGVVDVVSRFFGFPMAEDPRTIGTASVLRAVSEAGTIPPTYLSHGDGDHRCGVRQSVRLRDALEAAGAKVVLDVVPGAEHAADVFSSPSVVDGTVAFLREIWAALDDDEN